MELREQNCGADIGKRFPVGVSDVWERRREAGNNEKIRQERNRTIKR